jgi:pentatricopeptide repeat protein
MDKVFAVYDEMQKHGVECNAITYNTLLDACAKNSCMDRTPALLEDMRRVNSEPDLITYSTLIKGYCLEGSVDKACKVLEDLKAQGTLRPDEITYNSLLDGCAKQQRVDEALALLDEMQGMGIKPSNYTLSILVKLLGRTRRLSQAFKLVEELSSRHGLRPNVQVYTCLMQACFMARKLERALEVHDNMIAKGCMPDEKLYVALIRGCLQLHAPLKAGDVVRAAFQLQGGTLAMPTSTRGRPVGIDTRSLEEVCEALKGGGADYRAAAAALVADLEKMRGVRVGGHASPSKAGVAPWRR